MNLEQTQAFKQSAPEVFNFLSGFLLFSEDVFGWYKPEDTSTIVVEIGGSLTAHDMKVISASNLFCGIFVSGISDNNPGLALEFYHE